MLAASAPAAADVKKVNTSNFDFSDFECRPGSAAFEKIKTSNFHILNSRRTLNIFKFEIINFKCRPESRATFEKGGGGFKPRQVTAPPAANVKKFKFQILTF